MPSHSLIMNNHDVRYGSGADLPRHPDQSPLYAQEQTLGIASRIACTTIIGLVRPEHSADRLRRALVFFFVAVVYIRLDSSSSTS